MQMGMWIIFLWNATYTDCAENISSRYPRAYRSITKRLEMRIEHYFSLVCKEPNLITTKDIKIHGLFVRSERLRSINTSKVTLIEFAYFA